MVPRMNSLLVELFFVLLLVAATSWAIRDEQQHEEASPRYVLVEEHHHVVSHLVRFAREGFLRSHNDPPNKEKNPNGAILLHIDSHADMGLPPGLNHLPAKRLFSKLPTENTDRDFELLEHSVINDFLLLLGYMGIVDHIIFVEPPWSHLLRNCHYTSIDISMGVVPGKDGVAYASAKNSETTIFSTKVTEETMEEISMMMADEEEPVEIVEPEELLFRCQIESNDCFIRTVKFTTLPYQGAGQAIQKLLEADDTEDRDIILDIDLDGFSTTSPGASSLFETTIPDYNVLTRIFHTVNGNVICDMEQDYWRRLKLIDSSSNSATETLCKSHEKSFVTGPSFKRSLGYDAGDIDFNDYSRALRIVYKMDEYDDMEEETKRALVEVVDYYLPAIDDTVYDDDKFVELIDSFLMQPFFVPEAKEIESILDFHFDDLFRTAFTSRTPKVINVVRSPFYTPDHHLDFIECEVFNRLLDMFGKRTSASSLTVSSRLYHSNEVEVDRTKCLHSFSKFPPPMRINTGSHPHIDAYLWYNTINTFSLFFEDTDDYIGEDYMYDAISIEFVNEHKNSLSVKMKDKRNVVVFPGQRITTQVHHLTKWEIFLATEGTETPKRDSRLYAIVFNGKAGSQQSYGSISGRIPVHSSTPVRLEVKNPSDSGILVAIRSTESEGYPPDDDDGDDEAAISLAPGDVKTLRTVHGRRWSIHKVTERDDLEESLGEVIANATYGEKHSVVLFSNDGASGSEL